MSTHIKLLHIYAIFKTKQTLQNITIKKKVHRHLSELEIFELRIAIAIS